MASVALPIGGSQKVFWELAAFWETGVKWHLA